MNKNFKSVDYIITAKHYSKTGNARDWMLQCRDRIAEQRGKFIEIIEDSTGTPVHARIYRGHWIADCDVCNGAMFVDPEYPYFFCMECFNRLNHGHVRVIIFPPEAERIEIEKLLLERPVNDVRGVTDSDRAGSALPVLYQEMDDGSAIGLLREWLPHETLDDLRQQNQLVERWKKK